MAWSKRCIPKLFVWHSSGNIVRMKWRYYRAGLYTEKKRSHWLKQWPIRKGLGDKKGELSLVEDVIWTSSKRWTGQPMEKTWLWIFNISLQETYLHWTVSTLEFLQPQQTENQFNRYFGTQGFHDLFQRLTRPELDKILSILLENGSPPENLINSTIKRKLQQLNLNPVHTVKKCPVYLHIPWIGNVSMKFEKQITSAVKRCFFSVEPRVVFTTRQLLPATKKDGLPSHHQNNVIYQFVCHCDSR